MWLDDLDAGRAHWSSLVPGTFAAYLIVVLVREVRRLQVRSRNAVPPRGSQYLGP